MKFIGFFSIPGTTVEIQDLIFNETPLVVRTCGPHRFKTGQIVLLTGIKAKPGAPSQLQNMVEDLSQDQAMAWVDDCRFALCSVSQLPCSEETARDYIDFSGAKVALSVSTWALRKCSVTLEILLSLSNAAAATGLGHVAGKSWAGLCVIGDSLRSVVGTTASHVEQRQQSLVPGRWAEGLSWIQGGLRSASDFRAPDLPQALTDFWGRCVELAKPAWNSSRKAESCEECIQPFGAGLGSHDSSKHHCRHCGRVVCDACSKDRLCVPWEGHSKAERVCKACKEVVEVRNHALQVYDTLSERIRLLRTGRILPKKGAGKGPPLPKGKGKGKGKGKAKEASGIGALASDVKTSGDWVDLERPGIKFTRQKLPPSQSADNKDKETLILRVAMQGCKKYLTEIEDALRDVTLEAAEHADSWFEAVDQIMPLEDKLPSFLECLKDVPEDDLGDLTQDQRHLRRLFAGDDGQRSSLQLRWRALRLLRELANLQDLYWKPIFAAQRAIDTTLASTGSSSSDSTVDSGTGSPTEKSPQLREEVKNLVALLFQLSGGKYEKLPELADRTQVGKAGLQLFSRAWETGVTQKLNLKALLETLRPVLEEEGLGSLHVALGDFQMKSQELRQLTKLNAAALTKLEGDMKGVERGLLEVLEGGKLLLSAFGAKVPETCPRALAIDVDLHLESLRVLLDSLKRADPTPVAPRRAKVKRSCGQNPVSGKGKRNARSRTPPKRQVKAPLQAPGSDSESDETQDEVDSHEATRKAPQLPAALGAELPDTHKVGPGLPRTERGEGFLQP